MSPQSTTIRFGADCIRRGVFAATWQDAVGLAGEVLASVGATTAGYGGRMVRVIETFGPYVVVAPGIALVHARPESDVQQNAAAVLTFPDGVAFGHPENDPVRVVVALAVTRPEEHIKIIAVLARLLDREGAVEWFLSATDDGELADEITDIVEPLQVLGADGQPVRRIQN